MGARAAEGLRHDPGQTAGLRVQETGGGAATVGLVEFRAVLRRSTAFIQE